jgi:ATP-binding cassette subfamily B protein
MRRTAYAALVSRPLVQLSGQMQVFQRATAALGRGRELLATTSAIRPGPRDRLPPGPLGVRFDGVDFAYPNGALVLREVSFDLAPGRVLGVLGRTGSGKSTLARLVPRLYDRTAGAVCLGGVDRDEATAEEAL